MYPKTIPRSHKKKFACVIANATNITGYSDNNSYRGTPIETDRGRQWIADELRRFDFAKIRQNGPGKFTLKVHSRSWTDFDSSEDC